MRIIDSHTHFFSRSFFDALAAMSPGPGDPDAKLVSAAERAGIELPPRELGDHLSRWIGEMDRNGVEHMVTFASLPEEVPAVTEAAERSEGRLTPFALCNPMADGATRRVAELLNDKGFKGVLLFPAMHHFHVDGDEAAQVLEVVEGHGATAIVHCGILQVKLRDLLGLPRPFDLAYANPLALVPAANRFRNVRFVIPHFGAGFFRETLMVGAQCQNVLVDTSSSNGWLATQPERLGLIDVFERTLGVFGAERILFGTDSSVFPRGWQRELYTTQREALGACGASEAEREQIFGGNAARILGLG